MELPNTLSDALQALTKANDDLAAFHSLENEHTAIVAQVQQLQATVLQMTSALDQANANNVDLAAAVEKMKAAEVAAANKANAIVANLGVAPVEIQPEQTFATKTTNELWAEYNSLPITERNAFYAKHKAALSFR
jgi:hypothetical protein